ncbi:MAG: glycosyltransferase, partial [Planctomycetota bacterium]
HWRLARQCDLVGGENTGGQAASGTRHLANQEILDVATRASIRTKPFAIARQASGLRRPKRVLFVTTTLDAGGAELMLLSLVKHLDRRDVQPHILCLKEAGMLAQAFRAQDVPVFEGVLRFKTDAAVILRIHRLLVENEIDIVVVAHSGGDRMFWSTLAARTLDLPVVVWSHWFPTPGHKHIEPVNRALYRWIDAFVAIGEKHRLALIRHAHVPAGRITVIRNAIEVDRFLGAAGRDEARRRLHLAEEHVAIGIVANMRPEKRHDVFIDAAGALAPKRPAFRFFIIGGGPERDAVQAAASRSGLDHETLRLLGPRDDVAELLPGLDIVCLCSEVECFSVSMLESAAAGCAFIGPDVGCLTEFLEHGRTGHLIRPADVASLTDAMAELGDAPELRARLARTAQDRVVREFGADQMAEAFASLFAIMPARCCAGPVAGVVDGRALERREPLASDCGKIGR